MLDVYDVVHGNTLQQDLVEKYDPIVFKPRKSSQPTTVTKTTSTGLKRALLE